ncbi:MAG: polysaccharide biosynthesis tyrosine autokinase [Candidatus Omnitrophica bacterium]|nr:polysaccharide biosynthesis tyrosine autokinase [Candidatus Omnitrophota bacterium]MBU4590675.1 polysaccharide biosynthesis tyrosine autokinase [Candidatus Omnitrophota bacterium]
MNIGDINKTIHIKDYLAVLRRRKWIFISFFLITVTTIAIGTFKQQKIYRATATVIVDARSPEVLSGRDVRDVVELGENNYWGYRDYMETQYEIIKSRRLAYAVIKKLKLFNQEDFKKAKDPIEVLLKKLEVKSIRDTRMIGIQIDDKNPKQAARLANEFARSYVYSNLALKIKISGEAQEWLRQEVEKQKRRVTESELNLQVYKEENNVVSIKNQENITNDSLERLNAGYVDAQKRRVKAETTYKSLLDKEGEMLLENLPALLADNETLLQLKNDYLKQEALLTDYKKVYKHKHPKMIRLLDNIAYLASRIKDEVGNDYKSALEEERKLKIALDGEKKKALELDRKIIDYNALQREVDTNERMLEIVLNRLKETSISSQVQANNIRIQDMAEVPRKPIKPRKKLNIIFSMILGFAGGIGLAFFRDYMDTTLRDPAEIAALLQIPVLGSVPRVRTDGKNIKKKLDIDRIVEKDSHSLAAEAYRSIRTNLLFSLNHSSSAKSLVITSSVPREGKTLTAVNLAMMIANSGERVLLVDADMRKPRVHTIFNDKNESGLSEFLSGKNDFNSVVRHSGNDNLYVVTAGKATHRPAELLSSERMKLFLENATSEFSKIIFDSPPIALVTDAQILSTICTGVVLIAEGGKATRDLLNRSKDLLEKVDARILGIIVNNISLTNDSYSYPHYYYRKYYNTA